MNSAPLTGHDGPYPAPIVVPGQKVLAEWIDYNNHMNVGYYGIAFDKASDIIFSEYLGVGVEHVQASGQGPYVLQTHQHFLSEMRLGDEFSVRFRLVDHDAKRLHFFADMVSAHSGQVAATQEVVVVNVDHKTGRSAPYPGWAQARFAQMLADHNTLAASPQLGAALGLRRKP